MKPQAIRDPCNGHKQELLLWSAAGEQFVSSVLGSAAIDAEVLVARREQLFDAAGSVIAEALGDCSPQDVVAVRGVSRVIRAVRMRRQLTEAVPSIFRDMEDPDVQEVLVEVGQHLGSLHAMYQFESDQMLFEAFYKGDNHAFEKLYQRHSSRLRFYVSARTGSRDLTDEVMQETFLSAYQFFRQNDATAMPADMNFGAWLFTVAKRRLISRYRLQSRDVITESIDTMSDPDAMRPARELAMDSQYREDGLSPEQHFEREQELLAVKARLELVISTMKSLPPRQAEVVRLRFLEGLDISAASKQLGLDQTVLKARQYRAIENLKAALRTEIDETSSPPDSQVAAWRPDDATAVMLEFVGRTLPGEKLSRAWTIIGFALGRISAGQAAKIVGTTPERITTYFGQFSRYREEAELFAALRSRVNDDYKRRVYAARLAGRISRPAAARILGVTLKSISTVSSELRAGLRLYQA